MNTYGLAQKEIILITSFSTFRQKIEPWIAKNEFNLNRSKVENIEEDILDLIPLPSPSVKIQIMGAKVYLR